MKNKQIRRIIVLIMCVVFVFNLAVSAYASSAGGVWSTVSIPADIGVSSVMNGLGVLPGETPVAYDGIVERCVDYLIEQGRVVAGNIDAWKREQVEGTPWRYGFDVSIIDVIRAWLWDEKVVEPYFDTYTTTLTYDGLTYTGDSPFSIYGFKWNDSNYRLSVAGQYTYVRITDSSGASSGSIRIADEANNSFYSLSSITTDVSNGPYPYLGSFTRKQYTSHISCAIALSDGLASKVGTREDVSLGVISAPSVPLAEAYPTWYGNSIAVPAPEVGGSETDDDVRVYPFAPGDTLADTQDKTQEEVWAGSGSITDTPAIPDTVTLSDILAGILSIPQSIVASIAQALSNFFGISGTADAYAISLTDFFPFCIPFDIYDFLSVLSAEPEAPVFHWEIPVPQLGRTFDIDVDLSPWDPVAAVFRTFELLAFIVGLGMVTREKFLRS